MNRRLFLRIITSLVAIVCILVTTGVLSAQSRGANGLQRALEAQERNTPGLMQKQGVVGTAIGLGDDGNHAVLVLLEHGNVTGIPPRFDGVKVKKVITGKIYALPKPSAPGKPPKDRTPPAAPTGLAATTVSSSSIDLSWNANAEGDLAGYRIYRSATAGTGYLRIGSVDASSTGYSDTGLMPGTTYYYVITAIDTSGNESGPSAEDSATTEEGTVEPSIGPRPAPIGISTGHPNITAGTIGCRVTKGGKFYVLSNNHVYADENNANIGDIVLQPGPYDGGLSPRDRIGTLAAFASIRFHPRAQNKIDAAIAELDTIVVDEVEVPAVDNATPEGPYQYVPSVSTVAATIELPVKKHGRTTGLTFGEVFAVNATVRVTYGSGMAQFVGQIIVTPGAFSEGGDSGSLIVTETGNNPVGLLFAGSSSYTIANPIDAVLDYFGVSIDGLE